MDLFTPGIKRKISRSLLTPVKDHKYDTALKNLLPVQEQLYAAIPDNKRISYGLYFTIKVLGKYLADHLIDTPGLLYAYGSYLFKSSDHYIYQGIALSLLSWYGLTDHRKVLPSFKAAATHRVWEAREFAAGFMQKIIKKYPAQVQKWYLQLVKSPDPNLRRFVSESLRPVSENRWIHNDPEYSLTILRHLFKESAAYPRTSVGNNLSDLAKQHPDLVYKLVKQLVASGDKNSYWIAYRACRNLVKKEPNKVMALLKVNSYKYKDRVYTK